ncbi:class I SAM-dependent rRNA methyltransferase [Aurantibacillus circumpalustris]|uniref:class I SAM-dependent rRNA methyltransferase n=1 Tax=Aurantibacillus circumpalustris TaxID=3036359 RepID=UPI00295AE87A|nr:class I SAM-dependent rRNA methyltransferase [Aurantibacillus circumpalustris]
MNYPQIILNKGKEFSMQRKHPWVFSGAIAKKDATLQDGDLVEVNSNKNEFLGIGYYSGGGSISVRIISFEKTIIDEHFWFEKISKAWKYRQHLNILTENTNVCRLFFGEGDGVPGLILDYYAGHVVVQAHSWGVYLQKDNIVAAIKRALGDSLKSIYDKSAETLSKHFAGKTENGFLFGSGEEIIVKENGHLFKIDFINGQKTGFFIDQRDNRKLLAEYSKDKTVLNTFSYTGGFSVYAAVAGANKVHSVDVSAPAIALCDKNIELNKCKNHESFAIDTFDFLKDKKDVYDVIVLDPPAFAKSRDAKHHAVIGYKRLNTMAMKLIKANGIIFTFSCSGVVDKMLFYNTVISAALEAGRNIKVLHYLYQPADHPITPFFSEGEYLKGMVLWVE